MATQEIDIWADTIVLDPIKGNPQRRDIRDEEWLQGWLRMSGVSPQQLNSLFNLLTHYSPPSDICPYPYPDSKPLGDKILKMDGVTTITQEGSPVLYEEYGATLPDMTADNLTGFVWVVRNH